MSVKPAVIIPQYVQSKSSCPTLFLSKTGKDIKDLKNEVNEFSVMETESYAHVKRVIRGSGECGAGDRTGVSFSSPGASSGSHPCPTSCNYTLLSVGFASGFYTSYVMASAALCGRPGLGLQALSASLL